MNLRFIVFHLYVRYTETIFLKNKPDVYLLYLTAWVDDDGKLNFRKDIYQRDNKLIDALLEKPVYE